MKVRLAIIVACSRNRVIGRDNSLPWHLPEDLKHFKAVTMGKPLIMGRKTYESIGRPLPGRTTLVVTRQPTWQARGVVVCRSLEQALEQAQWFVPAEDPEIIVAGGEEIYRQCLPLADRVYLTRIDQDVEGDAVFPELDYSEWADCSREDHVSEKTGLAFSIIHLKRR